MRVRFFVGVVSNFLEWNWKTLMYLGGGGGIRKETFVSRGYSAVPTDRGPGGVFKSFLINSKFDLEHIYIYISKPRKVLEETHIIFSSISVRVVIYK